MDRRAIKVRDVMTPTPKTLRPTATLRELLDLLAQHDVNAVPVINADGTLRGIVSKLDLLRAGAAEPTTDPAALYAEPVERIMRPGILTVEPDDPLFAAVELMVETRLHSLPVVRRGGGDPVLVGIVSRGDLLRVLFPDPATPAKPAGPRKRRADT